MKRKWVVTTAVIALLVLGVTGGTLLAQEAGGDDDSGRKSLADRVAEILGLDSGDVQSAFDEAKSDIADERLAAKLDALVAKEIIDQAKADEILAWFAERPDGIPHGLLGGGHHKRGFGGKFRGHILPKEGLGDGDPQARFFGSDGFFAVPPALFELPNGAFGDDDIRARILERFQLLVPPDAQDS